MKHIVRNTLVGSLFLLVGLVLLYFFFLKEYLLLQSGEIDFMFIQTRVYVVPVLFVYGLLLLLLQPKHNTWAPWHKQDDAGKLFTKMVMILGVVASFSFYFWVNSNTQDASSLYLEELRNEAALEDVDVEQTEMIVAVIKKRYLRVV